MIPSATSDGEDSGAVARLSACTCKNVEPVGRWFEAYCHRKRTKQSLSHYSLNSSTSEGSSSEVSEGEDNEKLLSELDPKDWKNQDHYAVLGLDQLRYQATTQQIKRAYKKKVLKHHPDKRRARGLQVKDGNDDYFACITKAWEVLGVKSKRRAYDSVDSNFDDDVPSVCSNSKEHFYEEFRPVFKENARWSTKGKVPTLGDSDSSFEVVNKFYSFWYEFDSWREYSYLDEEEKEKGENRDERRWIEKQNKAARQKRKKEEVARIRQLVDNAYNCDPRIQKFKDVEKKKKEDQKKAKQEAARARAEDEEKKRNEALEKERQIREKQEAEAREKAQADKKERDVQRKVLKKERKEFRTSIKDHDYFASDEDTRVINMQETDRLSELLSLTGLQDINKILSHGDKELSQSAFYEQVAQLNKRLEEEKQKQIEQLKKSASGESGSSKLKEWTDEEQQLLIKAVNLFPAGTVQRWDTVASFITQHTPDSQRSAKEVLAKAKELQKIKDTYGAQKAAANEKAFKNFEQVVQAPSKTDVSNPSERYTSAGEQVVIETGTNSAPWSAEEQKLLEQALKTYPSTTKDRWDTIAGVIATRSKKDCMRRYKELAEMVKAKKAAQAKAAEKAKKQ